MCGGGDLEIGGRDQELTLGVGVESVLQTVLMFVITHAGASGIADIAAGRSFARSRRGFDVCLGVQLAVLLTGVCLLGVWDDGLGVALEGVESPKAARRGVPGADPDPPLGPFTSFRLLFSDRSRKANSFLYILGGHGG